MPPKSSLTQQQAFLRAIVEDPPDDTTRLVYADWLEDNGQPERAQFIRVQVALAQAAGDDPRRPALEREERKLLRGRKAAWKAELPKCKGVTWGEFSRGFVGEVRFASTYRYHQYAARVMAAAPIESIAFQPSRLPRSLRGLVNSRHLAWVRVLGLAHQSLGDSPEGEGVPLLASSKCLGVVEVLDLSHNNLGDPEALILAKAKGLPRLEALDLAFNAIGPEGARGLAASDPLAGLKCLEMTGNPLLQGRTVLNKRFGVRFVFDPQPIGG